MIVTAHLPFLPPLLSVCSLVIVAVGKTWHLVHYSFRDPKKCTVIWGWNDKMYLLLLKPQQLDNKLMGLERNLGERFSLF